MPLRTHQQEFGNVIAGIINGSGVRNIVAHVTPGGGKSTLPIQAGRLITAGLADRICWICPRMSLQDQAERNFIDPRFRRMFGHNLLIRLSTNEDNPCRGTWGFVTTYQAASVDDRQTILTDFRQHRYILILDEFHHLAVDGEWTEPIRELYDRAAFRVLMTGTLSRGDQKQIAFLRYEQIEEGEFQPCACEACEDTAFIRYTRRDALTDRAIIPLEFHFADGVASWRKESGKETTAKLSTGRGDANQALFTALKTEYAEELLTVGIDHWKNHTRTVNKNGSLMAVAANIETAKEYTEKLRRMGHHAEIATSDDTPEAVKQIKALKAGKLKILVTVAMAYEGLDVPSISHIICLTNVRSMPWIEQMVARAVRIDQQAGEYETQRGHIFAPADRMFVELARRIEADQCEAVAKEKHNGARAFGGNGSGGCPTITPLSSKLIAGQGDLFGYTAPYSRPSLVEPMKTQREIETELREEIEKHVRAYCRVYSCHPGTLNGIVKEYFGRKRELMTVGELERVKKYLLANYPVPQRREPDIVLTPVGRVW